MPKLDLLFANDTDRKAAMVRLRSRLNDLIEDEFFGLGHVEISEVLVDSAFAWRDLQGSGTGDIDHAARVLHDYIERIREEKIENLI